MLIEETTDGLAIRSAVAVVYSKERKAELNNATGPDDYRAARQAVRGAGPGRGSPRLPVPVNRVFLDANVLFSAA